VLSGAYGYSATTSQLTSVGAPGGNNLSYGYDGSLMTTLTAQGAGAGTVTYGYGSELQVASRAVSGGATVSFAYDKDGLLKTAGGLTQTRNATTGLLSSTSLGGVSTSHGHNSFGDPSSSSASYGGSSLYDVTYQRDNLGRITQKTETIGGTTAVYGYDYDDRGRLTDVTKDGASVEHYEYDGNGNRSDATTQSGTATGTYDAQDRLNNYGGASYTYSPEGWMASKTVGGQATTYEYDELGNLTRVLLANKTVTYEIDGVGHRVAKKVERAVSTHCSLKRSREAMRSSHPSPLASTMTPGGSSSRCLDSSETSSPSKCSAMPLTLHAGHSVAATHSWGESSPSRRSSSLRSSCRSSRTRTDDAGASVCIHRNYSSVFERASASGRRSFFPVAAGAPASTSRSEKPSAMEARICLAEREIVHREGDGALGQGGCVLGLGPSPDRLGHRRDLQHWAAPFRAGARAGGVVARAAQARGFLSNRAGARRVLRRRVSAHPARLPNRRGAGRCRARTGGLR